MHRLFLGVTEPVTVTVTGDIFRVDKSPALQRLAPSLHECKPALILLE